MVKFFIYNATMLCQYFITYQIRLHVSLSLSLSLSLSQHMSIWTQIVFLPKDPLQKVSQVERQCMRHTLVPIAANDNICNVKINICFRAAICNATNGTNSLQLQYVLGRQFIWTHPSLSVLNYTTYDKYGVLGNYSNNMSHRYNIFCNSFESENLTRQHAFEMETYTTMSNHRNWKVLRK